MRKLYLAVLFLFLVSNVAATSIGSENVTVDIESSTVEVDIEIKELTASAFSYITSYPVQRATARINGEPIDCSVNSLQIGSEVSCETNKIYNYTVNMEMYAAEDFVSQRNSIRTFRYSHSVYRPTDTYRLRAVLPAGDGLLDNENLTTPVVSPADYRSGSNGRRIFVEWSTEPELGQTLTYKVMYEEFESATDYLRIIGIIALIGIIGAAGYYGWRWKNREEIETLYDELSRDEVDILELLSENEGEMLQKDIVDSSDYSKAKISEVVSKLVEKEIVEKEKEGRSNKLKVSKKYRV